MAGRISQQIAALLIRAGNVRLTQQALELLLRGGHVNITTEVLAILIQGGHVRASQLNLDILFRGGFVHASQVTLQCLMPNIGVAMPPIYPQLPGLGYDVKWTPTFYNMPTTTTVTGADIDLGLSPIPLHDFELIYNFLRDRFIAGTQEFKTMFGFFLSMNGTVGRFLFPNPDDNYTTNELVGETDGATILWTLNRTFGAGTSSGVEPIGWIDESQPMAFFLDGVLMDPTTYQVIQNVGCQMQFKTLSTLASGHKITGNYGYFYYCKFPDNANTFNKFMDRIWGLQKITIHSCRAGA